MKLDASCMRYMTKQVTGGLIYKSIYTYMCMHMCITVLIDSETLVFVVIDVTALVEGICQRCLYVVVCGVSI